MAIDYAQPQQQQRCRPTRSWRLRAVGRGERAVVNERKRYGRWQQTRGEDRGPTIHVTGEAWPCGPLRGTGVLYVLYVFSTHRQMTSTPSVHPVSVRLCLAVNLYREVYQLSLS